MDKCRLCGDNQMDVLLQFGEHPIAHRFLDRPDQDEYTHHVTLCFCQKCGLTQLNDPIPADLLYANYICLSSWKHQPHIPYLVQLIEEKTTVKKPANILEVGSNDGRFLRFLKDKGYRRLIGIEPACDAQTAAAEIGVKTIPAYFNKQSAENFLTAYGKCDLFISRQMLEHINDLKGFGRDMRSVLSPGAFVLFEVPDFSANFDILDYALWEEHINYFTIETLSRFLADAGIKVIHSESIIFSGNSLVVLGEYVGKKLAFADTYLDGLKKKAQRYRNIWPDFRDSLVDFLRSHKEKGGKIAIYGAGARLCSLVNYCNLRPYVEFIVDDQPEKQGKYMPGSRLSILPSSALRENSIDLCLLAVNSECEERVIGKHPDFLERGGVFFSLLPPSERLPDFWKKINA